MIGLRQLYLAAIFSVAVASICSPARAGYVTYSASTPANMTTDFSMSMAIPAFNASLGTLESVVVTISDQANMLGTVTNHSASTRTFNISEDVAFGASLFGNLLVHDDLDQVKNNVSLATGQSTQFGLYSLTGTSGPTTIIDPTTLAEFTGSSPLSFNLSTQSGIVVSGGGGNTSNVFHTTADATVSVTYNYISSNVVPEPASLTMTALGGLLVLSAGYLKARTRKGR